MQMQSREIKTMGQLLKMGVALVLAAPAAQAAVVEYQLQPGSEYHRTRTDVATQLPVADTGGVAVAGSLFIDTATGALVSGQLTLSYSEHFDYAPLAPHSDYADIDSHETQLLGPVGGVLSGTVLSFSGAAGWAVTSGGSASCAQAAGAQGGAACAGAAIAPWGGFDIDLLFTPDFSAFIGSASWFDSVGGTANSHTLDLFAVVSEVPVPGAVWLFGSAFGALGAARLRRRG